MTYILRNNKGNSYLRMIDDGYAWTEKKEEATQFAYPNVIAEVMQQLFSIMKYEAVDTASYFLLKSAGTEMFYSYGEGLMATYRADPIHGKRFASIEEAQKAVVGSRLFGDHRIIEAKPTDQPQQN